VSVTAQGYETPQTLEIAIRPSNKDGTEKFEVSRNVTLENGKTQLIELDVSGCGFIRNFQ
jgi:hypothetical protein